MKRATVNTDNIDRIEYAICPPMGKAITLPVLVDDSRSSITVYVAAHRAITDAELSEIAQDIAWRINRTVP